MKQKVYFKTFGCRTNLFDTQVMKSNLKSFECVEDESSADVVVVNSCTVTNGADSGVRNYLHKMRQKHKKVYFTGCGVYTKGKDIFQSNLAHGVFAHSFKERIDEFLSDSKPFFYQENASNHLDKTIITHFAGKSRAFIKIQEGCNFACSYCIIPFTRGVARSYPKEKILAQIQALAQNGISEVVLTGTNVGSYGKDLESYSLARLIRDIDDLGVIKRLRIGSLEPSQIDSEFREVLHLPIIERHLHIALQHTSDTMLALMNRHNRSKSDLALFKELESQGFCLGSDFIVGHPGETLDIWEEAWDMFRQFPLTHLHPFIYSKRSGTPSSTMGNEIRGDVSKERLHLLKEQVERNNEKFRIHSKMPLEVLLESEIYPNIDSNKQERIAYSGLDQFFNRVHINTNRKNLVGQWVRLESYQINKEGNYAEI